MRPSAYSPLGRGFLTGSITKRDDLEADDRRLKSPRFTEENIKYNLLIVEWISQLAKAKNCTPAQLALTWIVHQDKNIVSIPCARNTNPLQENANAIEVCLSGEEVNTISSQLTTYLVQGDRYG